MNIENIIETLHGLGKDLLYRNKHNVGNVEAMIRDTRAKLEDIRYKGPT